MTAARKHPLWLGALALVLFAAYYPVIFSEYGFTDDYIAITFHKEVAPWDFRTLYTALGRPICSVLTGYGFGAVDTVGDLSSLRAFSLGWLMLCGATAFLLLRDLKVPATTAALTAGVITLNPAAGVYAGWAITFIYPFSIFLSLLAGWFFIKSFESRRWLKAVSGSGCLLASFFIYQPSALACLTLFAAYYFCPRKTTRRTVAFHWIAALAVTSTSMVLYYIIYQAYLPLLEPYGLTTERGGIVNDISGKLAYFIKGPLWESTVWWGYYAPKWTGWGIVCGVITSILYLASLHYKENGWKGALIYTGLLLATVLLASSPILVPYQNNHQLRVFYPLMAVLGTLPAIACSRFTSAWPSKIGVTFALLLLAILGGLSHFFVKNGIVKPHSTEVATYKTFLQETVSTSPQMAFFKHPFLGKNFLTPVDKFHEYGVYSSWLPWVPYSLINVLLWEQFPDTLGEEHTTVDIIQIYPWQIHHIPEGAVVIDGNYVFKGTKSPPYTAYKRNMLKALVADPVENPLFGLTETLNRDWYYSLNFGFIRWNDEDSYDLLDYGTFSIQTIDSPHGDVVMIDDKGDRLITSADEFPKVYNEKDQRTETVSKTSR